MKKKPYKSLSSTLSFIVQIKEQDVNTLKDVPVDNSISTVTSKVWTYETEIFQEFK